MSDLVAFLKARLDEDEATARAATEGPWSARPSVDPCDREVEIVSGGREVASGGYEGGGVWRAADVAHILRHDPVRALREVGAKREMIDGTWGGPDHEDMWEYHLRLLASVYVDHPDYREEWLP